ncbi:Cullin [Blyttiomyces helicus]|uniref:Cullin n=1 Tax=Blyttiomyces helicus TaxID=388810 RepID=A0A4P9W453_9FUNG|nr:Cullin [Blyttiomyces helicus]|eukprot:RKO86954.1 Cullin [Blyttiomyces helicus]
MSTSHRKPKIKAPTRRPFPEVWEKLRGAIREVYNKNNSKLSFEEVYRNAYTMVLHKSGDKLYEGVKSALTEHLEIFAEEVVVPAFPESSASGGAEGERFLKAVKVTWDDHTTCVTLIKDIFMYMDKVYVGPASVPPVYDLGLNLYRDVIVRSLTHPIRTRLVETLLDQIRLERENEMINRSAVKGVVQMLATLTDRTVISGRSAAAAMMHGGTTGSRSSEKTVYEIDFELKFLEASRSFYRIESETFLRDCDAKEYLKRSEARLEEEENRIHHYLIPITERKIREIVEDELLQKHVKEVIEMENSGLVPMLTNDRIEDLSRMYKLFGRVTTGHREMRSAIGIHIKELGRLINETWGGLVPAEPAAAPSAPAPSRSASSTSIAADPSADSAASAQKQVPVALRWVEAVLALKDKFDTILNKSFAKDKGFQTDMDSALEIAVNQNSRAPEFVSLFIDENLRKGIKGKTEEEIDSLLDKTITFFRFIQEKDVFEKYYKSHLAKRLLYGRSASEEAEKSMIAKLKAESGYQFTTKLEGMFNDMRTSADTIKEFPNYLLKSVTAPANMPELSVSVLTNTFWPMNATTGSAACNFPREVAVAMEQYERFYLSRHSGRRLTWLNYMGTADLKATFDKGRKEINVSTFAMVVLVGVFNKLADGEWITYDRIREETAIPDSELKRTLQSLSLAKYKILLKNPKSMLVSPSDKFSLNLAFSVSLNKIKILTIAGGGGGVVEAETERRDTLDRVDEDRRHQVEAAIVRVMKSRKKMDHNNLVSEVIQQLSVRFRPSPVMVKKRIEGLIEREYLDRDKDDR